MACRSPGRGPSSSVPGTDTISLISWMPSFAALHEFGTGFGRGPGVHDRFGFDLLGGAEAIEHFLEIMPLAPPVAGSV